MIFNKTMILTNLGYSYYSRDKEKAEHFLKEALSIHPIPSTYRLLSQIYADKGDLSEAVSFAEKSLKAESGSVSNIESLRLLSQLEQKRGNYRRSAELSRRAFVLKDSLAKRQHEDNVKALQIDLERQQEKEKAKKVRLWLLGGMVVMAVMGAVTLTVFVRNGRKNRNMLDEKQHSLEELRKAERQTSKELSKTRDKVNQLKRDRQEQEKNMHEWQKNMQLQERTMERGHHLFVELTNGGNIKQWSRDDFKDFRDYYDTMDKTFASETTQKYGHLSQNLYVLALLEHLGKSDDEIMAAMGLTLSALRTTRSRLNSKKG